MAVSGLFGKHNIEKLDAEIEPPDEIYAQTEFPLKVRLRNRRRFFPAFLVEVKLGGKGVLFPFVSAGKEATGFLNTRFTLRGRHTVRALHICSVFPFNFFMRCRKGGQSPEVVVFPRAKQCELWGFFTEEAKNRGEKVSTKTGCEGEIVSFRNYHQGDPLKYIYWKASAKTGELKTKELSSPAHQPVTIDFDEIQISPVEEKLSCITYAILKLLRQNVPVGLKIGGTLFHAGLLASHKLRMLKELALYASAPGDTPGNQS